MTNCKKCEFCVQVSKNTYEVRCSNKKVADSDIWVTEPDYCKYYIDKKDVSFLDQLAMRLSILKENYNND